MTTDTTSKTPATLSTATATSGVGVPVSSSTGLSSWVAPYVTEMLGKGQALAEQPYQAYGGPLTAGESALQQQAFQCLAGLTVPQTQDYTAQSFTAPGTAQQYMNPYLQAALQPQIDEARRQAAIQAQQTMGQYTKAGAFGGGRQAIAQSESDRNLLQNLANITGQGYQKAYDVAQGQFNTEQAARQQAAQLSNQYGLQALQQQQAGGATQRDITQQGITADINQYQQQLNYPYQQLQFQQSLLSGLPVATTSYNYTQPTTLQQTLSGAGGLLDIYNKTFGGSAGTTNSGNGATQATPQ